MKNTEVDRRTYSRGSEDRESAGQHDGVPQPVTRRRGCVRSILSGNEWGQNRQSQTSEVQLVGNIEPVTQMPVSPDKLS